MRRFFILALTVLAIGAFTAPATAGAGKAAGQSTAPAKDGHGYGGGCYDSPKQSKAEKPTA